MNQFKNLYSQYYDLFYSDKDYKGEVEYVDNLIKKSSKGAKTILDLGCGTGKHAELFCDRGYTVHGVDLSKDMLKVANDRRLGKEENLKFTHSDICDLNLKQNFDIVMSLFHVISYQNSNIELISVFEVVNKHLNKGGLFIFDFWYGPAVLTDLPTNRVKRFENNNIKVTRIAEPLLQPQENIVDVNYDVFITDKKTKEVIQKQEVHKMRYLFDTELELICNKVGLTVLKKYEWMSDKSPSFNSWNTVWVVEK